MSDDLQPDHLGTTDGAGERVDQGRGRIFPCEGCGADLEYSIGQGALECSFCGFVKAIELDPDRAVSEQDFMAMLGRLADQRADGAAPANDLNEVRCSACGATVVFPGTLTSSECSFCASPIQRDAVKVAENRVPVDGVLPFLVDRDQARLNLAAWVKSRWFAPNEFKRRGTQGRFDGVYLPFWTFDSHTFTRYSGQRGEYYYVTTGSGKNKRTERRTRWYPASGSFARFYDDVLVTAAERLPAKQLRKLEPWPLNAVMPFNQQVLAGYLACTYDIELHEGFHIARKRIDASLHREACRDIGGDTQRVHSIESTYDPITYKHLLLPLWLMTYRFRNRSFGVVVNAATGEVHGDHPLSWVKIALASLGAAVVVVLVLVWRGG